MKKILFSLFTLSALMVSAQVPNISETKIPVGGNRYNSTAVGDINNDGNLDVVITKSEIGAVVIYYGDGNLNFSNTQSITVSGANNATSIRSAEIIDWDLDGDLDILVADIADSANRGVWLIKNTGIDANNPTNITTSVSHLLNTFRVIDIAVGNFSGSMTPDLAILKDTSNNDSFVLYEANGGTTNVTLTNLFVKNTLKNPSNLKIIDNDNDGDLDFVFSDVQNNRIRRFKNNGTSGTPSESGFNHLEPRESAFADLDGDGIPEHIYINSKVGSSKLSYRITDSNGALSSATTISTFNSDSKGFGVAASDFDSDGDIDIVVTDFANTVTNTNPVKYFQNTGSSTSPTFTELTLPFTGNKAGVRRILVADFDNDGNDDFLVEETNNTSGNFIIYHIAVNQKTIFVNKNATGTNDGTSWANAFTTLQEANYKASPSDNIWVAAGTYKPVNKTSGIAFNNKVNLYGGFNGTETTLNQRDIPNNPTVLSGDINGDDTATIGSGVVESGGTRDDNAHTVLRMNRGGLVDGFILRDGQGTPTNISSLNRGSALYLGRIANELIVRNCKFYNNLNRIHGAISVQFENSDNSIFKVENCEFAGNVSPFGSAFTVAKGGDKGNITAEVTNSLFHNNKTEDVGNISAFGSTLYFLTLNSSVNYTVDVNINNCTITNNIENSNQSSVAILSPITVRRSALNHTLDITINNSIITRNINNSSKPFKPLAALNSTNKVTSVTINNSKIDENGGANGFSTDFSHIVASTSFTEANVIGNATNVTFNDFANNDYSLNTTDTNLIDTGDNTKIPTGIIADLANNQRIANSIVDMGAYEFNSTPILSTSDLIAPEQIFVVYPNPTKSILYIDSNKPYKTIEIFTLLGEKVLSAKATTNLNISGLNTGMYLLKIIRADNEIILKKIIKD